MTIIFTKEKALEVMQDHINLMRRIEREYYPRQNEKLFNQFEGRLSGWVDCGVIGSEESEEILTRVEGFLPRPMGFLRTIKHYLFYDWAVKRFMAMMTSLLMILATFMSILIFYWMDGFQLLKELISKEAWLIWPMLSFTTVVAGLMVFHYLKDNKDLKNTAKKES